MSCRRLRSRLPLVLAVGLLTLAGPAIVLSAQDRRPASNPSSPSMAFTHVTVLTMAGGAPLKDQTVVVHGNRITALGPSAAVSAPRGSRVVVGRGKFLIPGLWEMHGHLPGDRASREIDLPLHVANGVTGVRNMWGDCEGVCAGRDKDGITPPAAVVRGWKRDIAAGILVDPRIVTAGNALDGPQPFWPGSLAIRDTVEAKAAVIHAREQGADFIKVIGPVPAAAYFMVLRTARDLGLPVAGHVPGEVGAITVSDSGQRSIEHLQFAETLCSSKPDSLTALRAQRARETSATRREALNRELRHVGAATFGEKACQPYFARLVRNGTWQVPTHTVKRAMSSVNDPQFQADSLMRYATSEFRASWAPQNDLQPNTYGAEEYASMREEYAGSLRIVGAMARAGVPLLAGSDVNSPHVFPGFALHDELALFVEAGLSPEAALAAATVSPARYFGATDSLGTIAVGKLADMVLLDADPLTDIHNTRRIRAVVLNGRLLERTDLTRLLTRARSAAEAQ
jgi:imidazolonepropionase-like amidohydrolase